MATITATRARSSTLAPCAEEALLDPWATYRATLRKKERALHNILRGYAKLIVSVGMNLLPARYRLSAPAASRAIPSSSKRVAAMATTISKFSAIAILAELLVRAVPSLAEPTRPAAPSPVFVTLGTAGGPPTRLRRSQPANAMLVNGTAYLFDAGDGVLRQMVAAGIDLESVKAVFLSHHHLDHTGGVQMVMMQRWLLNGQGSLEVIGPPGTQAFVRDILVANRAVELAPVTIGGPAKPALASAAAGRDLAPDMETPLEIYRDANIRVLAVGAAHYHFPAGSEEQRASRSYAFRIETGGRSFVYTGDTGPSAQVEALARGADILVSEVIDLNATQAALAELPGMTSALTKALMAHMRQNHLTPEQVGALATSAQVKEVVLTHLAPGVDTESDTEAYARGVRATFKGRVIVANDLDRF